MRPYVLLVEDDHAISELVGSVLEEGGYACVRASSLERALQALDFRAPDVLLVDFLLDDGRTCEPIVEHALAMDPAPAVVMLSGTPSEGRLIAERYRVAYVPKPFEIRDLLDAVDRASASRTTLRPR